MTETAASAEMPRYACHKQVHALKIKSVLYSDQAIALVPEDGGYAPIELSLHFDTKHNPQPGGYYVVYDDGYASYSPAQAFESGYIRIS